MFNNGNHTVNLLYIGIDRPKRATKPLLKVVRTIEARLFYQVF